MRFEEDSDNFLVERHCENCGHIGPLEFDACPQESDPPLPYKWHEEACQGCVGYGMDCPAWWVIK
jgi:hypothetical protein